MKSATGRTVAPTALGVHSQLIMCFLRDWSAEFAMTTLLLRIGQSLLVLERSAQY
jgi:hypothetical protein